jgi:hypothetical protein
MTNIIEKRITKLPVPDMIVYEEALDGVKRFLGRNVASDILLLERALSELAGWRSLADPENLFINLKRGIPSRLSAASLLDIIGAGRCSNLGYCCLEKENRES